MIGKRVSFESQYRVVKNGKVNKCSFSPEESYYLLFYFDSKECLTCSYKHIPEWNTYVENCFEHEITPLFLFEEIDDFSDLIVLTTLNEGLSIYVEENGSLQKTNKFIPDEPIFHTLLIGPDHTVLAVGNPMGNDTLTGLYKRLIQ